MKRLDKIVSLLGLSFIVLAIVNHFIEVQVNVSTSLPQHFFLVLKGQSVQKGDCASFYATHNDVYPKNIPFIKKVAGIAGDIVSEQARVFSINGESLATAKAFSKQGKPLEKGPTGKLKEGEYFVYAPHPDSFDSRYKDIGWIKQENVVGKAIPLF